jgi:hypothetical protein
MSERLVQAGGSPQGGPSPPSTLDVAASVGIVEEMKAFREDMRDRLATQGREPNAARSEGAARWPKEKLDILRKGEVGRECGVPMGHGEAMVAHGSGYRVDDFHSGAPKRSTLAHVMPAAMPSGVDLPAPFGWTSPSGNDAQTSRSAMTGPKGFRIAVR